MESLIKQTRTRFSGVRQENKEKSSSTRELNIPEKKTRYNWTRQMSWDYDSIGTEYPTAVAAAAFAVHSLDEPKTRDNKETEYFHEKSLNKNKSKVEDAGIIPQPQRGSSLKFSDETLKTSFKNPDFQEPISKKIPKKVPSIKKKVSFDDTYMNDDKPSDLIEKPAVEKTREDSTSIVRTPTLANENLNATDEKNPDFIIIPKPVHPKQPFRSKADAWEKSKMESIKERYENLIATIEKWETKKKKKAKLKIERIEDDFDNRRSKAMDSYHNKIARIEEIAGGARAQAEENRRKEEFKVRKKANKIRATGKMPATCLCF